MGDPGPPTTEPTVHRSPVRRRSMAVLAVVGFSLPIIAYFWFIHHYALNIIRADQWSDIQIIADSYSGHLSFADLWAQHYENRILFPNLIVLLLSRTTSFNVLVEEYVSAALLVASTGLLILAHRRRVKLEWVYYCPVAILMLSFVQHQNTLWGFQLAWYLVLFAVAATFTLLDRPSLTWWWLTAAIAAAVVASYSSLQGLFVWPTGLLLLYYRNRPRSFTIAWLSAAAVSVALYVLNYVAAPGTDDSVIRHPISALQFYFVAIGDVIGVDVTGTSAMGVAILVLGVAIFILAIWVLVRYCRGRDETSGMPIAAALIIFGLLFTGLITLGRVTEGLAGASQSRYRTFDLLILVGLYMAALDRWAFRQTTRSLRLRAPSTDAIGKGSVVGAASGGRHPRRGLVVLTVIVTAFVCLQIVVGIPEGLAGARTDHANQILSGRVDVNVDGYPASYVRSIIAVFYPIGFIRQMAEVAQEHHLSVFSTDAAAKYRAEGLIPDTSPLVTDISRPMNGAVLKGQGILSASAPDRFVTKVEFEITGQGEPGHPQQLDAEPYTYGWIALWRTTAVPNGPYQVQSIAYTSAGRVAHSPTVSVVVRNP
jgi:hypothetical protein